MCGQETRKCVARMISAPEVKRFGRSEKRDRIMDGDDVSDGERETEKKQRTGMRPNLMKG